MSFSSLGLSDPLLKAISDKGYQEPSPIQMKAIPEDRMDACLFGLARPGPPLTKFLARPGKLDPAGP